MTKFSVFLLLLLFVISSINIVQPRKTSSSRWSLSRNSRPSARQPSAPKIPTNIGHTSVRKTSSDALIHSERVHASKHTSTESRHTSVQYPHAESSRPGTITNNLQGTPPHRNTPIAPTPAPIGFEKFATHRPLSPQNSPFPSPSNPSRPYTPYPIASHPHVVPHHFNGSHSGAFHPSQPQQHPFSHATAPTPPPIGFDKLAQSSHPFNYPSARPPSAPIGFDRPAQTPVHQPSYMSPYPHQPIPHFSPQGNPTYNPGQFNTNYNLGGNVPNPHNVFSPTHSFPPPNAHGAPYQTQHFIAQPAAQPIIPGQTIMMIPEQRDSGRGTGQLLKEALVFSTVNAAVNAAVNRIVNPPHHHIVSDSVATGTTGTAGGAPPSVTHITYNQYFNNQPIDNNTTTTQNGPQVSPLSPPLTPAGVPMPNNPTVNANNVQPIQVNSVATGPVTGGNTPNVPSAGSSGISTPAAPVFGTVQNNANNNEQTNSNVIPQYAITDEELYKISEKIFAQEEHDISKYLKINLQNRSTPNNTMDVAPSPLFEVDPEVYDIPSIRMIRDLYDNYEHSSMVKEKKTIEEEKEENIFLDFLMNTNAINTAMGWLSDHNFIYPDDFEKKDTLRQIWFSQFNGVTSGFERVFVSELYGDQYILGVQDWIYFNYAESHNRINYMGYVDKLDLGNRASLVKVNFQLDGVLNENKTIFVGTTPELEMSLYTICFYARPNNVCPVSIGGTKFNIFTHAFRYFGRDLIDLAVPVF